MSSKYKSEAIVFDLKNKLNETYIFDGSNFQKHGERFGRYNGLIQWNPFILVDKMYLFGLNYEMLLYDLKVLYQRLCQAF